MCHEYSTAPNTLACTKAIDDSARSAENLSAAAPAVVKDLVRRPEEFLRPIWRPLEPWLKTTTPTTGERVAAKSRGSHQARRMYECILCACCSTPARAIGGIRIATWDPPELLQANRWVQDSRDEATGQRLDNIEDHSGFIAATPS
jgi:succinate dehydrogenase / fumarate reductase iron-sulfur subunit